jgi:hypothetical protein
VDDLVLTGLDGSNPLGFFAALGALQVLTERHGDGGNGDVPRLSWRDEGCWRPVLHQPGLSEDALVAALFADREAWPGDLAISLRYQKGGTGSWTLDLKPIPADFRAFLDDCARQAATGKRRAADYAAAYATEIAVDANGNTKPTAFHFASGQQQFLATIHELAGAVTAEHLQEALFGPWQGTATLKSLGWDATVTRLYALRASDPSGEKRGGVPGADWLAFRALALFPVAPVGARVLTTCCEGSWSAGRFRWPLWVAPATCAAVRSLLRLPTLAEMTPVEREARGIAIVFESAIERFGQGYGKFCPSTVR